MEFSINAHDAKPEEVKWKLEEKLGCVFGDPRPLPGAGSGRVYYRLPSDRFQAIYTNGSDAAENASFVALSDLLRRHGINVPEVYLFEEGIGYFQEDLGSTDLLSLIKKGEERDLPKQTMRMLAQMQTIPEAEWDDLVCYKPFGERLVMFDLNYFKYDFLKPLGYTFDEDALQDEFERFTQRVLEVPENLWGLMMRDCQSRNVMVKYGEATSKSLHAQNMTPYFIDFQSARKGPGLYDAVSFAWQAKAGFSAEQRQNLLKVYAEEFGEIRGILPEEILRHTDTFVILRTLQVLGAYGFRGVIEKKAHFIESLTAAAKNFLELYQKGTLADYPQLSAIALAFGTDPRFLPVDSSTLQIKVFSFSYKKGYPEDLTGNGGGFMFDCRGMHNPGRYEEYKTLTGRDKPVIDFLEERGEVQEFLKNAWGLIDPSVSTYLRRGFSSLQIGFGCTGGQHRSVYCAEATARHLRNKFPEADVILIHREQGK